MARYFSHRCVSLIRNFTFLLVITASVVGQLPDDWSKLLTSPVAISVLTISAIVFLANELRNLDRLQRTLDHSGSPHHESERGLPTTLIVQVSPGRRLFDLSSFGLMVVLVSGMPLSPGSSAGFGTWHSISLAIAWICHGLASVKQVERNDGTIVLRTILGSVSIPLSLLTAVAATPGSGYFLRFRFVVGSIYVINPGYPSRDVSAVSASLAGFKL